MKYSSTLALLVASLTTTTAAAQISSTSQSVRSASTGQSGSLAIDGFPQVIEWTHLHPADETIETGFTVGTLTVGSSASLKSVLMPDPGRIRIQGAATGELACEANEGGITSASANAYYELTVEAPGRMMLDAYLQVSDTVGGIAKDAEMLLGSSRITLIHPDGHLDSWTAPQPAFSNDGVWIDPGLIDVVDPRRVKAFVALEPGTYELILTAEVLGTAPHTMVLEHSLSTASFTATVSMAEGPAVAPMGADWLRGDEGGVQVLRIDGTPARAGAPYVLLGSLTPGETPLGNGLSLPFAVDAYTLAGLASANRGGFEATVGVLDADGLAHPALRVPADPRLAGLELLHAPVLLDAAGGVGSVGNAVTLAVH